MGPPEFLVGVDERFEAMSAPGLFSERRPSHAGGERPGGQQMVYRLGAPKGIVGVGFAPMSPSSILTRRQVRTSPTSRA